MKNKFMIGVCVFILVLLWAWVSVYPDWLWFQNLGYLSIFWTILFTKVGLGALVWLLLILIAALNLYAAKRLSPGTGFDAASSSKPDYFQQFGISGKAFMAIALLLVISLTIASRGAAKWDLLLRYFYQQPFGNADPLFNKDIAFYVFSFPFYVFIQKGLLLLFLLAGGVTVYWYMKDGALQMYSAFLQAEGKPPSLPPIRIRPNAKKHLILLGGIIALLLAWGFYLRQFGLLYSTQGPAFGASYTDVHVKILAYRILAIVSLGLAVVLFANLFKLRMKVVLVSGAVWIGTVLTFAVILPTAIQKFVVKPNELAKESPFITYNIHHTRKAYNLDNIKVVNFAIKGKLSAEDITQHDATIKNVRIWDERPLLRTYKQIQSIRLYYDFNDVDVDRYQLNGQYRQVMLSARELIVNQLPAQANTWVNRHLTYTHGYGLASSPVNEVTREGLPRLIIKDLPPVYEVDLRIERPEIYYGEKTDEYVLVKTKTKEFDYPKGDKNVYTHYQGRGGVPVKSFIRRLLFSFEFVDPQILFTTYLTPQSRIMYNRQINRRVRAIAPFLDYDSDPYLVVSQGKLYWIIDAYTTSEMYPYSRRTVGRSPFRSLNYIRNSVKVTIDAYNGNVSFYLMDERDPIVKTYSAIFPQLFRPFQQMPGDLKKHIRYPRDLFRIQADVYRTYHMQDVRVFYNQEDLWETPNEMYGDSRQEMEPYYIIIKLSEENREEFLLMLPFTPSSKDNMIGWLAARSDLPNYGHLLIYKLPKEKLIFGPMQVEARVDQQTDISRELSLWGQRGSRVIRGNLLAIPLSNAFIYVEPVYLEAQQQESKPPLAGSPQSRGLGKLRQRQASGVSGLYRPGTVSLPELKRVIVAFSNRVVMEKNLERALSTILSGQPPPKTLAALPVPKSSRFPNLEGLALEHYKKAKTYLRQGKWAEYGRELESLGEVLKELATRGAERQ